LPRRETKWTESIAVGNKSFVMSTNPNGSIGLSIKSEWRYAEDDKADTVPGNFGWIPSRRLVVSTKLTTTEQQEVYACA